MGDAVSHWQSGPLPWQREQMTRLAEQYRQQRLPHALLLAGPEGIGKEWFAGAAAAGLLCQQSRDLQPCGRCDSCEQFKAGSHGDQRWVNVLVELDKKAIGIDQIRSAIAFVQKTAVYGRQKVLVVSPAEKMTVAAANALLKTLEEPSDDTLIMLVSHQPWLLPITVRSRCQQWVLPTPNREEQSRWLSDAGLPETEIDTVMSLSAGRPLAALAMSDPDLRAREEQLAELWESLLAGQGSALLAVDALKGIPVIDVLTTLQSRLEQKIRGLEASSLRVAGTRLLTLHRCISTLLRRLRAGATPGREILLDNVCAAAAAVAEEGAGDQALASLGEVLGIGYGKG